MNLTKQSKRLNVILPINMQAILIRRRAERLEHFYEEKLQGIIIRARARWCEQGEEKSTKYFLNLTVARKGHYNFFFA